MGKLLFHWRRIGRSTVATFAFLFCSCAEVAAQDAAEEQAYKTALTFFADGHFEKADKELGQFAATFPDSARAPEVILLQAQSRIALRQFEAASELLSGRLDRAGTHASEYAFWIAEAEFQRHERVAREGGAADFSAAARRYGELLEKYPDSHRRVEAGYGQAFALFKAGNKAGAVDLLKNPSGAFQKAAQSSTNEPVIVRGFLLLGDIYFDQQNYVAAAEALNQLEKRKLSPEDEWQRQFSLARVEVATGKVEEALNRVKTLVDLATQAGRPVLHANALNLRAEVLKTPQPEEAIKTYEEITGIKDLSPGPVRQAVLRIVELNVSRNQLSNAIVRLDRFIAEKPQDPGLGELRLMLGGLHLKHYYQSQTNQTAATGSSPPLVWLQGAKQQFDLIITQMTNSPLLGKAYLNRGWCWWEEGDFPEARAAFLNAVERLPVSEDQETARFKLGESCYRQNDFTNAVRQFQTLLEIYSAPEAKGKLLDQALYQLVRCHLGLKDFENSRKALDRLLSGFPASPWAERGLLVSGQTLLDHGKPAEARSALAELEKRFPASPLLVQSRLARAESYVKESNWPGAASDFDGWLTVYTNHPARAQAEFDRAWVYAQAGRETNALAFFTNYVARYASSPLAAMAQLWVADHYFNLRDFEGAERNYQHPALFASTNATRTGLSYQARLMAGKSALLRQDAAQARSYLTNLISELNPKTNAPSDVLAEAYFILGEVELEDPAGATSTSRLQKFDRAITAFNRIPQIFKGNRLEPLARGKLAQCYLQVAWNDGQRYSEAYAQATTNFHQVMSSAIADVTARSQAEVGLGKAYERHAEQPGVEKQALLRQAWESYLNVIYEKNVRRKQGEQPDPFWIKEAALAAEALADRLDLKLETIRSYERLKTEIPVLKDRWQQRIDLLQKQARP